MFGLRKARFYNKNLSIPQSQSKTPSWELGDVGDSGRLRHLHSKVDTTIECESTCTVSSAQCSGCVVYGPTAVVAFIIIQLVAREMNMEEVMGS